MTNKNINLHFSRNPFVKFLCHSASYIFFLFLLAMASQRIEYLIAEILGKISSQLPILSKNKFTLVNRIKQKDYTK